VIFLKRGVLASGRKWQYNSFAVACKKEFPVDMFRCLSIALAAAVFVPFSGAQMGGAMGRPFSGAHAGFAHGRGSGFGRYHGQRPFASGILLNSPFLDSGYDYSNYYSDYDATDPGVVGGNIASDVGSDVQGASSQVVFVQPVSVRESPRKTKPGPLLIEWRDDRYVRFGGEASEQSGTAPRPDYEEPAIANTPVKSTSAQLPPAVVVYRDGRHEEIADYTIADGIIYLRGNDWQSGCWTKRVPLSALDPLATIQANRQRGVKFMLPSAPNVVIASF